VRRHLFEEFAGFDTGFSNGFEDVDLFLRMSRAGHEVHFCAESVLVHDEAATRGENREAFERNLGRYLDRWRDELRPDELATYVDDRLLVVEPSDLYPLRLTLAPELAVVETDAVDAFKLLRVRAAQVFDLLKESARLRATIESAAEDGES
jgi:GT2 family glycosyltransferase